ncbi:uncharacterized protein YkwD [Kutzneria buriramensis]|uniref:Uncharacterized protein YkwD n=2 Tax=Kutzneria buriramensis TaxID=1045776 RepID=A0A3E0HBH1_9PSEU|nr:uncharacterized protein YkwD [Kutzneria buriramensis]
MLVGLTLGAACAGAASVAVGPATLTGVLLGEASPLTASTSTTQQLGSAAGHELNNRPVATDAPADTTSSSAPTTTSTTTATSTTTTTSAAPSSTSAAPTTTTTSKPAPVDNGPAARVLDLVNQARASNGCQPLTEDKRLDAAAQGHSDDMAAHSYFSHTSQDGRSFVDREQAAGYPNPGGENIAEGYTSADAVMDGWMHSDGHRRNILDCSFTTIGIGVTTKGWYWVQDFGR